MVKIAVLSSGH